MRGPSCTFWTSLTPFSWRQWRTKWAGGSLEVLEPGPSALEAPSAEVGLVQHTLAFMYLLFSHMLSLNLSFTQARKTALTTSRAMLMPKGAWTASVASRAALNTSRTTCVRPGRRIAPAPTVRGYRTGLGPDLGVFCDFLCSALLLNAISGLCTLGLALSRPQVLARPELRRHRGAVR